MTGVLFDTQGCKAGLNNLALVLNSDVIKQICVKNKAGSHGDVRHD